MNNQIDECNSDTDPYHIPYDNLTIITTHHSHIITAKFFLIMKITTSKTKYTYFVFVPVIVLAFAFKKIVIDIYMLKYGFTITINI